MSSLIQSPPAPRETEIDPEEAYESTLRELTALGNQRLLPINLDVMTVTTTVLGMLPDLRRLQAQLCAEIRGFDAVLPERLARYTLALQQAHARYNATSSRRESLAPLVAELAVLRKQLLSQARSLTYPGWIEREALTRMGKQRGYLGLAGDVLALVAMFRRRWSDIVGHTPFTSETLRHAERLAWQLLAALGRRGRAPETFLAAVHVRQQIFTLLVRTYDQARRALCYVRGRQRDADRIAPSLYAGRSKKGAANVASREQAPATREVTILGPDQSAVPSAPALAEGRTALLEFAPGVGTARTPRRALRCTARAIHPRLVRRRRALRQRERCEPMSIRRPTGMQQPTLHEAPHEAFRCGGRRGDALTRAGRGSTNPA